jgi:hypothetical protein
LSALVSGCRCSPIFESLSEHIREPPQSRDSLRQSLPFQCRQEVVNAHSGFLTLSRCRFHGGADDVPAGLTVRRSSVLILGWGALDEGNDKASDMGFDGRGTLQKKFHWRPVAPT